MTRAHPLDPLSAAEIEVSVATVKAAARSAKVWQQVFSYFLIKSLKNKDFALSIEKRT
jgi:Cu2+-containing amine oxidase